ncbi:SLATT domain-containing protein [Paracoccus sp. J39]|uniref:SLATT domain-containing protein n=1 Tax=Paracoccus sp. J39 TaxID=935848 RepID=UPI0004912725|nr:SLATT domain-containing protein [Paracoccus sp. J39]
MSRIFLSHSPSDNAAAVALRDWLVSQGFDDLFLGLDPVRGILAGERWERALNEAVNRCEAVVLLISRAWLASTWCRKEMTLALRLNKPIFGVLIQEMTTGELPLELAGSRQIVQLARGTDHRMFRASLPDGREAHVTFSNSELTKLKVGLTKAGLDPRFFLWPPDALDRGGYLSTRLDGQIGYYKNAANRMIVPSRRLHGLEFVLALAAALTAIAAIGKWIPFDLAALTAVFTTLSGTIIAHLQASRYDELILSYRATANRLSNLRATLNPDATAADIAAIAEEIIGAETRSWQASWLKEDGKTSGSELIGANRM